MEYKDLELVRSIIKDATDLDIIYTYNDLVFPEHSKFIIQFDNENENNYFCYFRDNCSTYEQENILSNLIIASHQRNCTLVSDGVFELNQIGEEVEIQFL